MQFCPKCNLRLKKGTCTKCGYSEAAKTETKKSSAEMDKSFTVFEEDEGKETLPTIKKECEKCGNDEAVWWMLQTRSADEPTTQFYRCSKCAHTWRDYS
ncbi:transcription factor S [Candidatus Nitrosotenuis aquarius]|uniref:transcription factor S n=1 Tax=Candidatus Nitrosotenuis aquarius TaxID=1846278 RepID=UPI000C1F693B|nr:transcription factor S [Candidatus Nitrosotenuis aquarius]